MPKKTAKRTKRIALTKGDSSRQDSAGGTDAMDGITPEELIRRAVNTPPLQRKPPGKQSRSKATE